MSFQVGEHGSAAAWTVLETGRLLDIALQLRLAAFRDGYELGREVGFAEGMRRAAEDQAAAWRAAARRLSQLDPGLEERRWSLRGEPRTQATFAHPHQDDYPGQEAAA